MKLSFKSDKRRWKGLAEDNLATSSSEAPADEATFG